MKKLCLLVLGVLTAFCCFAQESEGDIQVVVTANREEQNITDVPANITVITKEQIGNRTVVEALETYAGLYFTKFNGNSSQAAVSMRGFGENSHGRVLVLVDGIKQNNPDMSGFDWIALPSSAIERIEVLHGGASAVYGSGAVAGVINIITRTPDKDKDIAVDAEASVTSFKGHSERFYVSSGGRHLSFSLSGNVENSEGWRDRTEYDLKQAAAKLDMEWSKIKAGVNFNVFSAEYQMPGALLEEAYDDDPKEAANDNDDADLQGLGVSAYAAYNLMDFSELKLTGGFRHKENKADMESWGSYSTVTTDSYYISPTATFNFQPDYFSDTLIIGADFYMDNLNAKSYSDLNRDNKTYDNKVTKRGIGAFLNNDICFLDDSLTISLGARIDREKIDADFGSLSTAEDDDVSYTPVSFTAGINYLFPDSSNVYFRYDRVYRTPFTDEQVSYQGWGDGFADDLDPEYGNSFELGFNFNYFQFFSIGASGYILLMKDEIAYNNTTFQNENLDDTIHYGINVKAKADITKYFSVLGFYNWTVAKFTSGDYDDNWVPLVPEHTFTLVPTLYLPYGFSVSADLSYTGKAYVGQDFDNDLDENDAYFLTNLTVKYTYDGRCRVSLFGRINNLFNVEYASCGYVGYDPNTWAAVPSYYPGNGREFVLGGSISY